jgi:hypothetical protein
VTSPDTKVSPADNPVNQASRGLRPGVKSATSGRVNSHLTSTTASSQPTTPRDGSGTASRLTL